MLTLEKPSPFSNKVVIAAVVFSFGFIGSLSTLRILHPGLGQLSSGLTAITAPHSNTPSSDKSHETGSSTATGTGKKNTPSDASTSAKVTPVAPKPVDPPASSYTAPLTTSGKSSGSGSTVQVSGQVAPTSPDPSTLPGTSLPSTTTPQPSTGAVSQPSDTLSSPSPTAPITPLTQPVTDTAKSLLPPLCSCDQ